ncbi:MAG: hypothetical protein ACR2OX_10820 [Methyloligellaceae bacterium]
MFENPLTDVERNLYWCIAIDFNAIAYLGERWDISAGIEWLRFDKSCTPLSNSVEASIACQPNAEASFNLAEHWPSDDWRICMRPVAEDQKWILEFDLLIDFAGLDDDPVPDLQIRGSTSIDFEGIVVIPDNLDPKPKSEQEAAALVAQYIKLDERYSCKDEGWRFVFRH